MEVRQAGNVGFSGRVETIDRSEGTIMSEMRGTTSEGRDSWIGLQKGWAWDVFLLESPTVLGLTETLGLTGDLVRVLALVRSASRLQGRELGRE